CTRRAARAALDCTWRGPGPIPFIPVVLGGDDLTILCDGGKAVDFTVAFLRAFEMETADHKDVIAVAKNGLSACAGIAIVKPHFPFHRAYELAESLIKEAKTVKEHASPCSAFDFQVLFDTSGADLEPIRERMCAVEVANARLTFRPYVVTPQNGKGHSNPQKSDSKKWLGQHDVERLRAATNPLKKPPEDEDGREREKLLPRTQQHALREAIHISPEIADARLAEIKHRYKFPWDKLFHGGQSLFLDAETDENGVLIKRTYLLDALDLVDLDKEAGQ
ncbi:MAG: hypothetical protein ABL907_07300, partial [Hyphomicrobium sp.]